MTMQENAGKRKKLILIISLALVIALAIGGLILFDVGGVKSYAIAKNEVPDSETPIATATKRPTATPTETPIPTSTPLAAERIAKCKNSDSAGTVQLVADWKAGDTRSVVVSRYRQRIVRRKANVIVQSYTKYRIRVIDATPNGYTLEWTVEDSQVKKGTDTRNLTVDDLFLQDMLTLLPGLRVIYKTDTNGAYQSIENWDQVLVFHEQLHELFKLRLAQIVRNSQQLENVLAAIDPVWTDRAQIEQLYSQEIRAYHGIYGIATSRLQGLRRADTLPNLLGYLPLEAETEVSLNTYNAESGCAFVDLRRYLSPSSFPQLLKDFLTRQTQIASRTSSSSSEMASTRIEDNVRYNVDLNSNWLHSAEVNRTIMVETLNMTDGIIVTDVTDAAP